MQKKTTEPTYSLDMSLADQVERHETAIQLLQQSLDYMTSGIDEIKKSIADFRLEIKSNFASKERVDSLEKRIGSLEELKSWSIKVVAGAILLAVLALLGIRQ